MNCHSTIFRVVAKLGARTCDREILQAETCSNNLAASVVAVYFYFTLPSLLSDLQFTFTLLLLSLRRFFYFTLLLPRLI